MLLVPPKSKSKIIASFFVSLLYVHSWLLFCVALWTYSYYSSNYCHNDSCCSFQSSVDKYRKTYHYCLWEQERAKTIAIAIVGRTITIKREIKERSKKSYTKNDAKIIWYWSKRSNREITNIVIAILKIDNYFIFWKHQ